MDEDVDDVNDDVVDFVNDVVDVDKNDAGVLIFLLKLIFGSVDIRLI